MRLRRRHLIPVPVPAPAAAKAPDLIGRGADLVVGANTIVEVSHARTNLPRLNWALSRVKVGPLTKQVAKAAAELPEEAGLHGHKHALDATVAEVALRQARPVALLTSDTDDMTKLCGDHVRIIGL